MTISKDQYINITQEEINEHYYKACIDSNFELIKFLLTSKDIPINADIHYSNAIVNVCMSKNIGILKYLLTSDELKEKANVHSSHDYLFRVAHIHKNDAVLEYLIFDLQIKETNLIKLYIGNDLKTVNMFLNRDLNKNLPVSKSKQKSAKI